MEAKTKRIKSTLNVNVLSMKRSCLLNQTINKDNVPLRQKKSLKSTRTNKNATINQKNKWTTKGLKEAMDVVERKSIFEYYTSHYYQIPQQQDQIQGTKPTRFVDK